LARPNRVTPLGELIADEGRGLVYGNRGCLHDAHGRIRRAYNGKRWIACRLEFKGRRRALMQPGRFTELFFLDEATAFAAGHRPCAECRREDYNRFLAIIGETRADDVDERLHAERFSHHDAAYDELPEAAFVLYQGAPWLVREDGLHRWTNRGYTARIPRPAGIARVITPPTLVEVLRSGWSGFVPLIHH
jgi:hypothetical protein